MLRSAHAREGDWLVAQIQEAGRGRQGREWVSRRGNFFGSTIVDLAPGDPPPQSLSLAAGLALIEAVEAAAPDVPLLLKWPNDLVAGGGKLAGILLERHGERVIVGFGVNLAAAPEIPGRPAAHLAGKITPEAFAPLLAAAMTRMLVLWRTVEPRDFAKAWLARAHPIGTELSVHGADAVEIRGRFDGIEPDGAMRLRLADGSVELVRAGDVALG